MPRRGKLKGRAIITRPLTAPSKFVAFLQHVCYVGHGLTHKILRKNKMLSRARLETVLLTLVAIAAVNRVDTLRDLIYG